MKKTLLNILFSLLSLVAYCQPPTVPCNPHTGIVIPSNPVNVPFLRSDNCGKSFGSVAYQNKFNQFTTNNSLWFDGDCLWLNGNRLCGGGSGGNDSVENGLYRNSNFIKLGGKLTDPFTIIDVNDKNILIGDSSALAGFASYTELGERFVALFNRNNRITAGEGGNIISTSTNYGFSSIITDNNGNHIHCTSLNATTTINVDSNNIRLRTSNSDINLITDLTRPNFSITATLKDYVNLASANADVQLKPKSFFTITTLGAKAVYIK